MEKKSKILLITFLVLILLSVAITYYNDMVVRNFDVIDTTITEESTTTSAVETETASTSNQIDVTEFSTTTASTTDGSLNN